MRRNRPTSLRKPHPKPLQPGRILSKFDIGLTGFKRNSLTFVIGNAIEGFAVVSGDMPKREVLCGEVSAAINLADLNVVNINAGFNIDTQRHSGVIHPRSEERRVGKECRSRWSAE